MKKLSLLLSFTFIIGITQLSAMKRDINQITPSINDAQQELWLPSELITKIAAFCDPETRTSLSLVNKEYNEHASVRKEKGQSWLREKDRLYYLFYGCIHSLKNLVQHALKHFNQEYTLTFNLNNSDEIITTYPEKTLLNLAKHYIEQLTQSDATELLPHFPEIEIGTKKNALSFAIDYKDEALLSLLLKHPTTDINALNCLNKTTLDHLLFQSSVWRLSSEDQAISLNMAKLLLKYTKDFNKTWATLMQAARLPSKVVLETVKYMIAQDDIDINAQDNNGKTIIHTVECSFGNDGTNILNLLLAHSNINVNIQDNRKLTPLNAAIVAIEDFQAHFEKIKLLLGHPDINVNLQDYYSSTPLHNAVIRQDTDVITLLLAHPKINVNIQARDGNTPLHDAIENQDTDVIALLLTRSDIDFDLNNIDNLTPISLAEVIHERLVDVYSGYTNKSSIDRELLMEIIEDQLERIKKSKLIIKQLTVAHVKKY